MSVLSPLVAFAAAVSFIATPALAGPVTGGFDNIGTVPSCDDCFTAAVNTGFATNYFGTTYNQLYVSNNGYFTFGAGQGEFTPSGLGNTYAGLPIIAAYFADVDTRAGGGTVTYGTGTYNGRTAFGATWNAVGVYNQQTNLRNTFQILLTDRSDLTAGDFDIYFNYDQIQWETGSASSGVGGFGGVSAAVGFNAGNGNADGTFFEIPGSRVPGSFYDTGTQPLVTATNDGVPGQLRFEVRNGGIVVPPTGAVPEPSTWLLLIAGFGMIGAATRYRRRSTRTVYA